MVYFRLSYFCSYASLSFINFQRDGPTGPPLDGNDHEHDDGRGDVLQHHHLHHRGGCSNDDRTTEVRKLIWNDLNHCLKVSLAKWKSPRRRFVCRQWGRVWVSFLIHFTKKNGTITWGCYVWMPFIIQFALDVFSCFMFTTTIYCNLLQAKKLAKNTRNVSSTSSTQRPQRTGNDNVGGRLDWYFVHIAKSTEYSV